MSGVYNALQRRLRNHAPHAIYINCRCHRLVLCFKHLFEEFPWLQSTDSLLLGLWKTLHFSSKDRFILHKIQKAYGMKSLNVIKAAVTRWLSDGTACTRCRERYGMILGSLNIITRNPRPELIGQHDMQYISSVHFEMQYISSVHFRAYQDVLSQTESFAKQNIPAKHTRKKLRIDHLISIEEFHENIGKSFLVRLAVI